MQPICLLADDNEIEKWYQLQKLTAQSQVKVRPWWTALTVDEIFFYIQIGHGNVGKKVSWKKGMFYEVFSSSLMTGRN